MTTTKIDWNADYNFHLDPDSKVKRISTEDWQRALTYDSDSPEEMLTHPWRIYNDNIEGFDVAYDFDVDLDEEGKIVLRGTCYGAHVTEWEYVTYYDNVLARATITVNLHDPKARDLIKRQVRGEDRLGI